MVYRKEPLIRRASEGLICKNHWCSNTRLFSLNIETGFKISQDGVEIDKTEISKLKNFLPAGLWLMVAAKEYAVDNSHEFIDILADMCLERGLEMPLPVLMENYEVKCSQCGGDVEIKAPDPSLCSCEAGCDRCGIIKDWTAFVDDCITCAYDDVSSNPDSVQESYCDNCEKSQLRKMRFSIKSLKEAIINEQIELVFERGPETEPTTILPELWQSNSLVVGF